MRLGLLGFIIYTGYNIAAYGSPEFKAIGVAAAIGLTLMCTKLGRAKNSTKV